MITETKCSNHPDAPHGFDRNGSHMAGHYVCECSGWVKDCWRGDASLVTVFKDYEVKV